MIRVFDITGLEEKIDIKLKGVRVEEIFKRSICEVR